MSVLPIARMGAEVLRQRAAEVADVPDPALQVLVTDMIETMVEAGGVGLAAPQVYQSRRIVIFFVPAARNGGMEIPLTIMINPVVTPVGEATDEAYEACLSVPGLTGMVPRFTEITLRALNRKGKVVEIPLKDFAARVAQHETDHLEGVLFFDRMTSLQSLTYLDEYSRYHASERE